jgi:hypothetical protein
MPVDRTIVVVALVVGLYGLDIVARLRGPAALGPAVVLETGTHPVEREDGVICAPCPGERVSVRRRFVLGGRVHLMDPARPDELEALPGIGRTLARRIALARPASIEALAHVPGVGPRRARDLIPFLGLDGSPEHDICSTGSWPTTSSGCDKPR